MGKATDKAGGFLAPKAIANRIKSKGLTKLRWYCQLCEKACRDENGYKCHTQSESHLRQVRVFAENPTQFVDTYSKEFMDAFMEVLRRKGEHIRSKAKAIWTEVIAERHHIHLNATKWLTLTEFVKHLGREGLAEVDQDDEGNWHIRYINRDPEAEARRQALAKKERMDMDDAERAARMVEKQVKEAQKQLKERKGSETEEGTSHELKREEGETIKLSMSTTLGGGKGKLDSSTPKPSALEVEAEELKKNKDSGSTAGQKRKLTAVEELMLEQKKQKQEEEAAKKQEYKAKTEDHWLAKGIVVKVIHKKLADGKYHKKKGTVKSLHDKYTAEVKMLETGHVLKLDQDNLETVIPGVGGEVLVVNGKYRGLVGILKGLQEEKFAGVVRLENGETQSLPYEHISKLH